MTWNLLFFTTNIFLGIGLAMDAFSVSMANGLNEPHMNKGRVCTIAGVFGGFQALMPLIGWFCVHTIAESFHVFEKFIPWIALILLLFIGGKMLIEGIKNGKPGLKLLPPLIIYDENGNYSNEVNLMFGE